MTDELSALFRAAARDEAAAAGREFPFTSATLGRFVGHVRRRRAVFGATLAVAGVIAVGGVALGLSQLWHTGPVAPAATPSPSSSPFVEPSPSPTPSAGPSPMIAPSPTATASSTTPPPDEPPGEVPGQVTAVWASMGGGSGEVVIGWEAVADATGYRVYRSDSPDGPFDSAASYDLATGKTTIEIGTSYEYIGIWEPSGTSFEYIESVTGEPTYFRVAAFNAAGQGHRSPVVCSVSVTSSTTC